MREARACANPTKCAGSPCGRVSSTFRRTAPASFATEWRRHCNSSRPPPRSPAARSTSPTTRGSGVNDGAQANWLTPERPDHVSTHQNRRVTPDPPAVVDHSIQTDCSDPRQWAGLFDAITPTIASVSGMARNVVAHYRAQATELPDGSRDDVTLRWTDAI